MAAPRSTHVPVSTYRLQLGEALPFAAAARLAPYLERLGVTTCYASPVLAARPGSTHGYDTCDHGRLNPELGGDEGFAALTTALQAAGIGLIVDFVPNHMSIDPVANRWWRDVLENGPSSEFARNFDIDWSPVKSELQSKVLLPVLGDQYGVVLDEGHLQIVCVDGHFSLRYFALDLPLNPRHLRHLLGHRLDVLQASRPALDVGLNELMSILFHLDHMPSYTESDPDRVAMLSREKEVARQRIVRLWTDHPEIRQHLEENVRLFNGTPGDPRSFNLLHDLLEGQAYRLSYWRTAMHEINYRRFFDINDLAGIRVEEPRVFADAHARIAALVTAGQVDGLRLDHIDGLFDPAGYLDRLAALVAPAAPYVVVEKILSRDEPLPARWHTHGTTGYDFMNDVNGLFVDAGHAHLLRTIHRRFTGRTDAFAEIAYESKKVVIASSMSSELNVLAHWLNRISEQSRHTRDFTLDSLQEALREVVACFPVYRTYVGYAGSESRDEQAIDTAVGRALERNPAAEPSIFEFIRQRLRPIRLPDLAEDEYVARRRFAMKFQQYTGPVEAKGVEDTAFYRYTPLLSLNEVGGDPDRIGRTVQQFHEANRDRLQHWPQAMIATATHDTKRGEDARARINVLSELPADWRTLVSRISRATASARTIVGGHPAPDRGDEYLFYQALVGAWPAGLEGPPDEAFVARMRAYMQKAVKEAKRHTSWVHPSADYDAAVARFVDGALTGRTSRAFLRLFEPFATRVARLGVVNALAQLVLKIASPGVPDFYQGTELWDLSLVDPDNRRPVNFARRERWLDDALVWMADPDPTRRIATIGELIDAWPDGRLKLFLTAAGLRLRRAHRDLFIDGGYLPLDAHGERAAHVVALARRHGAAAAVAVVPRLVHTVFGSHAPAPPPAEAWADTTIAVPAPLAGSTFTHVFTGERIAPDPAGAAARMRVADLLRHAPVALLIADAQEAPSS
ncbi:MAG: malto-oligosyltrehalose synthase [Acidobacteria bacterium SCN 69-37]|nr:MAG: malto-oligosyltrehalose synthase [Acidobacteria bacterium SCN 69-37]